MYDVHSSKAEEFINHEEILATLQYAEENKENRPLLDAILEKAKTRVGLNHREAMVLLECPLPEYKEKLFALAKEIKQAIYGNRIVLFAPLYLSNYCINGCVYCPYHAKNKTITRKKLNQDQVREEVMALEAMGHKRIVIESGEHPLENPLEYILECIDTIYSIKKDNYMRQVLVRTHCSKKHIIKKTMKPFIQQALRAIMHTIQRLWIALWRQVLMTWALASFMDWNTTNMTS